MANHPIPYQISGVSQTLTITGFSQMRHHTRVEWWALAWGVQREDGMSLGSNGVQYASIITKSCPMHDDACVAKVTEHIASLRGPDLDVAALLEKSCGRLTRGANKGKLRGWAHISIVTEGGWHRHGGEGVGHVLFPGKVQAVTISDFNGNEYLHVSVCGR